MKSLTVLKKQADEAIKNTPGAKGAPVLTEDERSDIEIFKEIYENQIVGDKDDSRTIETDGFHASALGVSYGKCMRRAVYLLRGVPKEAVHDHRVLRIFALGHSIHERIQTTLADAGVLIEEEVEIEYEDPPIRGHADGVLVLPWNGKKILLEIKSCNDNTYINRLKFKKGKDEHFEQANIYAYILDIETIWIMYENKNNQEYEIFEHKTDRKKAEKVIDRWAKAYRVFKEGNIPVRPYKPTSKACTYCDLRDHCLADPEVGVTLPSKEEMNVSVEENF